MKNSLPTNIRKLNSGIQHQSYSDKITLLAWPFDEKRYFYYLLKSTEIQQINAEIYIFSYIAHLDLLTAGMGSESIGHC
jgi:hypothetical protein